MRPTRWTLALLGLIGATAPAAAPAAQDRPNVLFIAIDDLNDWVGHLGGHPQAKTPNIDRLAARGVTFSRAHCAAPLCNPSRAALMTGIRPSSSGVYTNPTDWRAALPADRYPSIPLHFRKHGYYAAGAGKIYHDSFRRDSDWDDYLTKEGGDPKPPGDNDGVGGIKFAKLAPDVKDEDMRDYRAVSYIIDKLNEPHDKPFFLACGIHKPHMPWNVPQKYYDMFPLESIVLPKVLDTDLDDVPPEGVKVAKPQGDHKDIVESGRWKEAVQAYLAAGAFADALVGRLLDALDRSPHKGNTVVVLWGDHGWHLGEKRHWRKFTLWEEATRAPLMFVVPGLTSPGGVCRRTVDFMSIYPTLADVCGLPVPGHVEGPSLKPLLADPDAPWDRPAVTTYLFNNHGIRSEGWRYIRYHDGTEELYDEGRDPMEWTNLAGRADLAATKAELARWLPRVNAPDAGRGGDDAGTPARKKGNNARAKAKARAKADN